MYLQDNADPEAVLRYRTWKPATFYSYDNRSETSLIQEKDADPPIIKDDLNIEDYPEGKISTAWINMVRGLLSEWLRVPIIVARGSEPGPVVGLTAAVHGNELNGIPCIHKVIAALDMTKLRGTVVAIPVVNLPGMLRAQREFSDKKDLNRCFPGGEGGQPSQVFAYNFMQKFVTKFEYLVDLHTASFGRVNSYYVRANMNNPGSATLAKLQHPQIILHSTGQDGTLRSTAERNGVTAITIEIGNPNVFQDRYVTWAFMGIMKILNHLNMMPIAEDLANSIQPEPVLCVRGFWLYTSIGGILEVYPHVNQFIRKGDLIARIRNCFGHVVDEYFSPVDAVAIGKSSHPVAMAGDRIIHVGLIKSPSELFPTEAKENY